MTKDLPTPGDKAPDFTAPTDGGGELMLSALKGKAVVLYFYPKDDTPGCTAQACAFREANAKFARAGAKIVGVSKDSVARHDKFKAKYDLPFPLVSDQDSAISEAYGVRKEKSMYGRKYMGIERSTFVIDAKGVIRKAWRKVKVGSHVDEVLAAVKALS
jgi:peroxiredoxin Q/BCP